jgi:dsDNA-specific endonuclease/ATPase MutS2
MNSRPPKKSGEPASSSDSISPFDEPVVLPLEDSIDLHNFHPKDVPSVIAEYLDQCAQAGMSEIRIIHGKGIGVQRNIIRSLLEKHPAVNSFEDAPAEAGGWGATVVTLKAALLDR